MYPDGCMSHLITVIYNKNSCGFNFPIPQYNPIDSANDQVEGMAVESSFQHTSNNKLVCKIFITSKLVVII